MEDEHLQHLYDIKEAISAINLFINGKTFDDYQQDDLLSGLSQKFRYFFAGFIDDDVAGRRLWIQGALNVPAARCKVKQFM